MSRSSRRRVLLATVVVFALAFSGCLTLNPTVATTDTNNSAVFADLSPTESWSGATVRTNATLQSTSAASNVTTITVIQENGRVYSTKSVDSGQSTVILSLPPNQNATIVASNSVNSTTISTVNVTTSGNKLF